MRKVRKSTVPGFYVQLGGRAIDGPPGEALCKSVEEAARAGTSAWGQTSPHLNRYFEKLDGRPDADSPKLLSKTSVLNGPSVAQQQSVEQYFVLNERGEPRPEPDAEAWTRWFERADRRIARTAVTPHVTVLTTFRGVSDAPDPDDPPLLFETRVFGGVLDAEEVAHRTKAEAMAAHGALAEWCRVGNSPDAGLSEEILN